MHDLIQTTIEAHGGLEQVSVQRAGDCAHVEAPGVVARIIEEFVLRADWSSVSGLDRASDWKSALAQRSSFDIRGRICRRRRPCGRGIRQTHRGPRERQTRAGSREPGH